MIEPGAVLTLDVEKPAAGGRMVARHDGQVVLVWGAIPGERVRARVDRVGKGVAFADTAEVISASADRRAVDDDWKCGGHALAHIGYSRQLVLKGEIISDAFARIGRVKLPSIPDVAGSPERGYRMRVRLHVHGDRIGFYREGTHELCDAATTGQLSEGAGAWLDTTREVLCRERPRGLTGLELTENMAGDQRACLLDLEAGADPSRFAAMADGLVGLAAHRTDRHEPVTITGAPVVSDVLHLRAGDPSSALRLRRGVRAFFQANRFLLEPLVRHVASLVPPGPVVDLYAGVGLFGLSLAAGGIEKVTLVEDDPASGHDLLGNAEPFGVRIRVERRRVEAFLADCASPRGAPIDTGRDHDQMTAIVDPPRSGLSKDAGAGLIRWKPPRIVYVSCDVATLARDCRSLLDAGYALTGVHGMDLFPNTAHVEAIATFDHRD